MDGIFKKPNLPVSPAIKKTVCPILSNTTFHLNISKETPSVSPTLKCINPIFIIITPKKENFQYNYIEKNKFSKINFFKRQ
jgi:hypothetical protein